MDTIKTKTIGSGFAEAEESVLTETAKTAIVFQPQFHEGGVRGSIIRYKKDNHGQRLSPTSVDFRKLNPNEGVEIELNTEALTNLLQRIQQLQTVIASAGVQPGTHQYRITNANDVTITSQNKAQIIQKLIQADLGEEIWEQLVENTPEIATKLAYSKIHEDRSTILRSFEKMLADSAMTESDWQSFFEANTWIFGYGLRYQILHVIQTQPNYGGTTVDGTGGQRGDFLTATEAEKKFTCLVEIKKPTTKLLHRQQYRNGSWAISEELAGAISQVQINCAEWEMYGARTERNRALLPEVFTVSPKGIVVIGKTSELDNLDKRNSFERFRREIRNPEIITYDELFERAKFIVGESELVLPVDDAIDDDELPF